MRIRPLPSFVPMARKKRGTPRKAEPTAPFPEALPHEQTLLPFPVVGIGASAGGLEAFKEMLRALPTDTGMAFVLVLHLPPKHDSLLPEILSRVSAMPICEVKGGMAL